MNDPTNSLPVAGQPWWREVTDQQRKALIAATLGWVLDSMDVLLYAIVLGNLIEHFDMSFAMGGFLNSLTLMSSAIGGLAFGLIADRLGRVRAMMMSILVYSIFTAACGFSQTITQLAIFRIILGLGVGGEWSTGAALISETWPERHRGKAFGIMQSGFAVGYAMAALAAAFVLPVFGWRAVFFIGVAPALFTLWIRRNVEEPAVWGRDKERDRSIPTGRTFHRSTLPTGKSDAPSSWLQWSARAPCSPVGDCSCGSRLYCLCLSSRVVRGWAASSSTCFCSSCIRAVSPAT